MAALGAVRADELTQGRQAVRPAGRPRQDAGSATGRTKSVSIAVQQRPSVRLPSSVQQNVPAWLIFAMFFVVIPVSSIFIIERQQGTLQRLRAMGLPFRLVLPASCCPSSSSTRFRPR
jgi:ABC-2 type transport system permease protein